MSTDDNPTNPDATGARAVANDAMREVLELREHVDNEHAELRDAIESILDRLTEVEDRTDLLDARRKQAATSREEKAAIILQTLYNEASDRPEGRQVATMTASEGVKALGGGVDRTTLYDVFPMAEELAGRPGVCEYIQESRGADRPSRLKVDLDAGDLPGTVAGHELRQHTEG